MRNEMGPGPIGSATIGNLLGLTCLCLSMTNCVQGTVDSQTKTSVRSDLVIYIQHVGFSDKPIMATVVCVAPPSRAEMLETLGRDQAELASIFQVSPPLLAEIERTITKNKSSSEGRPDMPYGTFRFSIIGPHSQVHKILLPEASRTLLSEIEKLCVRKQDNLRLHLHTILKRIESS